MSPERAKKPKWQSRAVLRAIEAGSSANCEGCGEQVKFKAKLKGHQAICNVYVDGKWDRVEHYHIDCYVSADEPYGEADPSEPRRLTSTQRAEQIGERALKVVPDIAQTPPETRRQTRLQAD